MQFSQINWMKGKSATELLHSAVKEQVKRGSDGWLATIEFTDPQLEALRSTDRFIWLRWGNQLPGLGKSIVMACESIYYCLNSHPYKETPKRPVDVFFFSASTAQSKSIQRKIWNLVPKSELSPATRYDPVIGFRGQETCCMFKNGSKIWFKTLESETTSWAGNEVDLICVDEPLPSSNANLIFSEMQKRVQTRNGRIVLGFAPVGQDCSWLIPLITPTEEKPNPLIRDLHKRCEAQHFIISATGRILKTAAGEVCDQAWIDKITELEIPYFREIRIHAEFDGIMDGSLFTTFDRNVHIKKPHEIPKNIIRYKLGIDHGSGKDFSSAAVLVGIVENIEKKETYYYVLDEYVSTQQTTTGMDAKGILDMLKRNGLKWYDLQTAFGDRVHQPKTVNQKSNTDLSRALCYEMEVLTHQFKPPIECAKRGERHGNGSSGIRIRWLNEQLVENKLFINSRCQKLIESFLKFDGSERSKQKHQIDALAYSLDIETFNKFRIKVKR